MAGSGVEQVRERIDIVDVIGQHVALRKAGRNFQGLCPFHQEKTPSFVVFPETKSYHCFGCGAGGDAFNFLMQIERIDFRQALEQLAKQTGVELAPPAPPPPPEQVEQHARLYELNRRAATFYAHILWSTPFGQPGRELLERRGVDRQTAERFLLGFAPDRWDGLVNAMSAKGITKEDMLAAGLASARDDGVPYDRFRNRLIFPIRDREGRVVGFGGRALGDAMPKYLNTAQTPIFDKSTILYAFDLAADAIRREREVIVVEGYMDAIAAHQFGFQNVVASMGTALTQQQISLVRRSVDRIILALDADAAGQNATLRGLDVLRDTLGEAGRVATGKPVQADPLRSLVSFERVLKTDIRIVRLPSGKDPDELIRKDIDAWRTALASAVRLLDFYVDVVVGQEPPADPREKSELVARILPVLSEISDSVEREHYIGLVARRLGVKEQLLRTSTVQPRAVTRRVTRPVEREPVSLPARRIARPEEYLVGLMLAFPHILSPMLNEITEQDPQDARNREILRILRESGVQSTEDVFAALPEELHAHAFALLEVAAERPTEVARHLREEAEETLQRMRKEQHDQQYRALQAILNEAEARGDKEAVRSTLAMMNELKAEFLRFYPDKSPYFRDVRDNAS